MLAAAGAVLLLASCSSQPNDLRDNRYYSDPETTTATTPPSPSAAPRPVPATATSARPKLRELSLQALTGTDLAAEGVQPGTVEQTVMPKLPDCNVPLSDARTGYQAVWTYPTGATLRQYVAQYGTAADGVVDSVLDGLKCGKYKAGGADMTVRAPVTAADGQVSWCATSSKQATCTAMTAHGALLSVVTVSAATETKAQQAVTRIAPLAANALTRNS